jgi:hypothetical protein
MVRAPLVDGLRGGFQPAVCRVRREFLRVFRSIHFVSGFLLHEVRGRSILECRTVRDWADGPRVHRGWSIIKGAVLEVRGCFFRQSAVAHGRSAVPTRTVRLGFSQGC